MTEIVLNLKGVVIDLGEKDEVTMRIDAKGEQKVRAGMLTGAADVVVVNPDHHICSLSEEGEIHLEITAKLGRGYVSSEGLKEDEQAVGTINVDAVFSPVRKVNHIVTNARVGQRTDYDKLTLEVWTDGSMTAEDGRFAVLPISSKTSFPFSLVMKNFLRKWRQPKVEEGPKLNENLFRRIDELELSVRSSNCLENADIKYIGELVRRSEAEMLRTKNFGRKSFERD